MYAIALAAAVLSTVLISEAQLPGGLSGADVNSPEIQALADKAVKRVNSASNDVFVQGLVKVVSAKTQVVAGTNTVLEIQMAPTNCRKNVEANGPCNVDANGQNKICTVTIWSKPWENFEQIDLKGCKNV